MFGLETLDVMIGLVTIYLAFAVACTAVVEAISAWLQLRAKNLEAAMSELLNGNLPDSESFLNAFYDHPLIQSLSKGKDGRPSYVPPELVGRVVESVLLAKTAVGQIQQAIDAMPSRNDGQPNRVKLLLTELLEESMRKSGDLSDNFRTAVSQQFDATMDRAAGWFKRRVQLVSLLVATALVGLNNVDTVAIATALSTSPEARVELVKLATERIAKAQKREQAADTSKLAPALSAAPQSNEEVTPNEPKLPAQRLPADGKKQETTTKESETIPPSAQPDLAAEASKKKSKAVEAVNEAVGALESGTIPIGWTGGSLPSTPGGWFVKVAGLLVSVFAVMVGAPFWFGVLQKLNAVRSTGTVPKPMTAKP